MIQSPSYPKATVTSPAVQGVNASAPGTSRLRMILIEEQQLSSGGVRYVALSPTAPRNALAEPRKSLSQATQDTVAAQALAAARRGDFAEVVRISGGLSTRCCVGLLDAGCTDIFDRAEPGLVALLKAAASCIPLSCQQFVRLKARVGMEGIIEVLLNAVRAGEAPAVRSLLQHSQVPVNEMRECSASANELTAKASLLFEATQAGHAEVVRALLEHGADPKLGWEERDVWYPVVPRYRDHSVVGTAVKQGSAEVLEVLLAAVTVEPRKLRRYLAAAQKRGHARVARVLTRALG